LNIQFSNYDRNSLEDFTCKQIEFWQVTHWR